MPRTRGMVGIPKFTCARCGRDYYITWRVIQDGKEVCTYLPCYDQPPDTASRRL